MAQFVGDFERCLQPPSGDPGNPRAAALARFNELYRNAFADWFDARLPAELPEARMRLGAATQPHLWPHGADPDVMRVAVACGAGSCNNFAATTAWLAACRMAQEGQDGWCGVFETAPGGRRAERAGYEQTHVVAGSYPEARFSEGVWRPTGELLVLDAWQEEAAAAPLADTRLAGRLDHSPLISFRVEQGRVTGARLNDAFGAPGPIPVDVFPSPAALDAIAEVGLTVPHIDAFLDEMTRNRPALRRLLEGIAETVHEPFAGGRSIPEGRLPPQASSARSLVQLLAADRSYAVRNQIFGSVSMLPPHAVPVLRSVSGRLRYAPTDHAEPYPGIPPTTPRTREQLAAATVTTDRQPTSTEAASPPDRPSQRRRL